ncbi:hypothetical protein ABES08_10405, partial [Peribacillus simplex]|uniref:hypothetical protein n=2 Tax=Peribacillus simplex TaxID=1478 RepID=UPI003D2C6A97
SVFKEQFRCRSLRDDFNNISTILFFVNNFFYFDVDLVIISSIRNKSKSYFKINKIYESLDKKKLVIPLEAYLFKSKLFSYHYSISSIYPFWNSWRERLLQQQ